MRDSAKIAVIGLALRVPGAEDEHQFWRNLCAGTESISLFSDDEIEIDSRQRSFRSHPDYVKRSGVLSGIDRFDADFFGCSAREAQLIDPQQRLFLQACWEAMENAGYDTETYPGLIGIYAGAGINTYLCLNVLPNANIAHFAELQSIITANDKDYLCSRVAYKLNLRGPAVVVQTACSTSLVAVHLACQSLLSGECDMALAGGVSVRVPQKSGYIYQQGGMLSPDGCCRPFDAQARGTVPANGLGVVVLKGLEEAIADGDHIRAVILGSAINNDGSHKVGFMAPGVDGQASVIAEAQAVAQVTPESIGYIEAHGTGTELGDPIEIRALNRVFGRRSPAAPPCALSSVKGNVGHLDTAAGVVGLIKAVLCLENHELPQTVNFEQPNPKLDLAAAPFCVTSTLQSWPFDRRPSRAGVSSFGIGGTNAHVVLEEAPRSAANASSSGPALILLSARTPTALEKIAENLLRSIQESPDLSLEDIAYTLQVGRRSWPHRRMFVARDLSDAVQLLANRDAARVFGSVVKRNNRRLSFLLPDLGAGNLRAAGVWYRSLPPFRAALDQCAELVYSSLGLDLRDLLGLQSREICELASDPQTDFLSAGALFSVEYAVAQTLLEWGLEPEALMGIGVGEYVAGCLAGVFPLEVALEAVTGRDLDQRQARLQEPMIPLIASQTGMWITRARATAPDYWFRHPRNPAQVTRGIMTLLEDADTQPVDLGPGSDFCAVLRDQGGNAARYVPPIPIFCGVDGPSQDLEFLWDLLGRLWLSGVSGNWTSIHSGQVRHRLPLPTYPFEGQSYWIAPPVDDERRSVPVLPVMPSLAPRPSGAGIYRSPQSDTELRLVRIWEEVLGCAPIGVDDDFFDLGGDSLRALQIATQLRQVFPVEIPLQTVAAVSTIGQLAKLIDAAPQSGSSASDGLAKIVGRSPLVTLQVGEAGPPFFCIHPAGGTVLCYVPLARRLGARTVYGLQSPRLYGEAEPGSIEEKAALFVDLIREAFPQGPYLVGGHSYGGNVAFEVASQLMRGGEHVPLLALLDSYPPEAYRELPPAERFREVFPLVVSSYFGGDGPLDPDASLLLSRIEALGQEINEEIIENVFEIWLAHFRQLQMYQPRSVYPGRITYFLCESDPPGGIVDLAAAGLAGSRRADAWNRLSSEPLEIHTVPGDHLSLLRAPYVDTLAGILRHSIERVASHSDRTRAAATVLSNPDG